MAGLSGVSPRTTEHSPSFPIYPLPLRADAPRGLSAQPSLRLPQPPVPRQAHPSSHAVLLRARGGSGTRPAAELTFCKLSAGASGIRTVGPSCDVFGVRGVKGEA